MRIDAFIPCQVFEVAFRVGPRESLSKLERLVLEAIHEGVRKPRDPAAARPGETYFSDLVDLFAIGYRPTLDLVVDLWRRAYLTVDAEGGIWLTDQVSQTIRDGRVGQLRGGLESPRRQRVWQELLSGHVLFPQRRPGLVEPAGIVPPILEFGSIPKVGRQELVSVLDALLNRSDVVLANKLRVLGVNLGFVAAPGLAPAPQHKLLQVLLDCAWDAGSERLTFRILDPPTLTTRIRADMERALAVAAETRLDHPFYARLRDRVMRDRERSLEDTPGDPLTELREKVEAIPRLDLGKVAWHHEQLCLLAEGLERRLDESLTRRVAVRYLTTAEEHRQAVIDAVQKSQQQLILIGPDLGYEALRWLGPKLTVAMERGVRVFVLWGLRAEASLTTRVANYLDDLKSRHAGEFHYSLRSMRTVARLLLQDGERILITSFPFLAAEPGSEAPGWFLGTLAERAPRGTEPAAGDEEGRDPRDRETESGEEESIVAARELLSWIESVVPVDALGRSLRRLDDSYARWDAERPASPLPADSADMEEAYRATAKAVWYAEWRAYLERLERTSSRAGGTARLVVEGEHQQLLWDFLRQPLRYVLVLSSRLSPEVVNPRLEEILTERLRTGTRVVIAYGTGGKEPAERLARLARSYPQAAEVFALGAGIFEGEVLVADDAVLISGAGLLSFSGEYDDLGRRRQPAQVGLLLRGGGAAQELLEQLASRIPGLPRGAAESLPAPSTVMPPEEGPVPPRESLQALLRSLSEEEREPIRLARQLRQWFGESPAEAAWRDLDLLAAAGFPDLDLAAACCLAVQSTSEAPDERRRWTLWLAARAWHEKEDPLEAAVLLQGVEGTLPAELPPREMVQLAASRSRPRLFADGLIDWTAALEGEAAAAGTACLAVLAVIDGRGEGAECLEALTHLLQPPLSQCAAAMLEYWREVRLPLSVEAVRRGLDRQHSAELAAQLRAALRNALTVERRRPHDFGLSRVTWEYLFGGDGPFAPLAAAVENDDVPAAAHWLAEVSSGQRALGRLLDNASHEAVRRVDFLGRREERYRRILGDRRDTALSRLASVIETARGWVEAVPPTAESAAERRAIDRTRILGERVRQFGQPLRQLAADAGALRLPEAPLLRQLTANLQPLEETLR